MIKSDSNLNVISKQKISPQLKETSQIVPQKAWCENEKDSFIHLHREFVILEPLIKKCDKNSKLLKLNETSSKFPAVGLAEQQQQHHQQTENYQVQVKCENEKLQNKKFICPWKIPWVVLTNSLIQILVYSFLDKENYKILIYSPYEKQEIWRFFTYSFLHSDAIHLILNVVLQILITFILETEQNHLRVFIVYWGGILAGSAGTSILQPNLLMVGSSAGVYSLLISHIPHIMYNFSTLIHRYFRIMAVIVLCLSDIIFSIFHCVQSGNTEPQISLTAHIGGAISGLLLGLGFYSEPKKRIFFILRYFSLFLYLILIIAAFVVNQNEYVINL